MNSYKNGYKNHVPLRLPRLSLNFEELNTLIRGLELDAFGEKFSKSRCDLPGGQTSVLQFCCSEVEPHAAPVPACGVVILLVRVCVPVPQFLLHVDQAPHAPMTQSTAEICKIDCTMGPGITSTIIK